MKDTVTKKIAIVVGCSMLLLACIAIAIKVGINRELNLQTTYIAARNIPPRTQVQATDLVEVRLPKDYLLMETYMDADDIIGKYTEIQGMIPAGSTFYKSMLYDANEIPDFPSSQLKDGQTAYTLNIDFTKLGGPLLPGQRVDVYLSVDRKEEAPISDCLLEHVRILAIKDHKGLDMDDENSTGQPAVVLLAVNMEDVAMLNVAEQVGTIRLFSSNQTYDADSEATLYANSLVLPYIQRS